MATGMDADGNWEIRSIDDKVAPLCIRFGFFLMPDFKFSINDFY